MNFDRDGSAGYLANLMARLFVRQLEARLRPLGLGLGAFPALLHLWERDGLTQRDLVDRLGIEQPTMAATLNRMERDGLITRQRDGADARVQRIRLTQKARGLRDGAISAAVEVNAGALAPLDDAERASFIDMMRRVIASDDLREPPGPAAP